jgi:hypothetical protein
MMGIAKAYRILLIILLRIYIQTCGAICCHGLVSVLPREELVLFLAIVDTLNHFRPHKRAFRDNPFQRYHTIEV